MLEEFTRQQLPGRLFLDVSVSSLADRYFTDGQTQKLLDRLGIDTSRIVIELTGSQHVTDFSALRDVLAAYRKLGYDFAVDDPGEGFAVRRSAGRRSNAAAARVPAALRSTTASPPRRRGSLPP